MSKLWDKMDKRPKNNTLRKEIERLERICLALHIAVNEKRRKHYEQDFEELGKCILELKRLVDEIEDEVK